jgi:hypothetical protein
VTENCNHLISFFTLEVWNKTKNVCKNSAAKRRMVARHVRLFFPLSSIPGVDDYVLPAAGGSGS